MNHKHPLINFAFYFGFCQMGLIFLRT